MAEKQHIPPRHVAVIMDGNGRWAKRRLLPRAAGHRAGMERMISLAEHAFGCGIKYFTLFALSTENLSRPAEELGALFSLFREYFGRHVGALKEKGVRLNVIGDASLLPPDIAEAAKRGEALTAGGEKGTLTFAIGYGGRREIVAAANEAVRRGREVTEEEFASLLWTGELPPPDLLIRTGGEMRISNFLLWQAAYAELYFTDTLFPDFGGEEFDAALREYASRERRFGKL